MARPTRHKVKRNDRNFIISFPLHTDSLSPKDSTREEANDQHDPITKQFQRVCDFLQEKRDFLSFFWRKEKFLHEKGNRDQWAFVRRENEKSGSRKTAAPGTHISKAPCAHASEQYLVNVYSSYPSKDGNPNFSEQFPF